MDDADEDFDEVWCAQLDNLVAQHQQQKQVASQPHPAVNSSGSSAGSGQPVVPDADGAGMQVCANGAHHHNPTAQQPRPVLAPSPASVLQQGWGMVERPAGQLHPGLGNHATSTPYNPAQQHQTRLPLMPLGGVNAAPTDALGALRQQLNQAVAEQEALRRKLEQVQREKLELAHRVGLGARPGLVVSGMQQATDSHVAQAHANRQQAEQLQRQLDLMQRNLAFAKLEVAEATRAAAERERRLREAEETEARARRQADSQASEIAQLQAELRMAQAAGLAGAGLAVHTATQRYTEQHRKHGANGHPRHGEDQPGASKPAGCAVQGTEAAAPNVPASASGTGGAQTSAAASGETSCLQGPPKEAREQGPSARAGGASAKPSAAVPNGASTSPWQPPLPLGRLLVQAARPCLWAVLWARAAGSIQVLLRAAAAAGHLLDADATPTFGPRGMECSTAGCSQDRQLLQQCAHDLTHLAVGAAGATRAVSSARDEWVSQATHSRHPAQQCIVSLTVLLRHAAVHAAAARDHATAPSTGLAGSLQLLLLLQPAAANDVSALGMSRAGLPACAGASIGWEACNDVTTACLHVLAALLAHAPGVRGTLLGPGHAEEVAASGGIAASITPPLANEQLEGSCLGVLLGACYNLARGAAGDLHRLRGVGQVLATAAARLPTSTCRALMAPVLTWQVPGAAPPSGSNPAVSPATPLLLEELMADPQLTGRAVAVQLLAALLSSPAVVAQLVRGLQPDAHALPLAPGKAAMEMQLLPLAPGLTPATAQQLLLAVLECLQPDDVAGASAELYQGPGLQSSAMAALSCHHGSGRVALAALPDPFLPPTCRVTARDATWAAWLATVEWQRAGLEVLAVLAHAPGGCALLAATCDAAQQHGQQGLAHRLLGLADAAVMATGPGPAGQDADHSGDAGSGGTQPWTKPPDLTGAPLLQSAARLAHEALVLLKLMLVSGSNELRLALLDELVSVVEAQRTLQTTVSRLQEWGACALLTRSRRATPALPLAAWARPHAPGGCGSEQQAGSGSGSRLTDTMDAVRALATSIHTRAAEHLQHLTTVVQPEPMQE